MALCKLVEGNALYMKSWHNPAFIGERRRIETTHHGQHPYAVILTCSDSRVPPEHIFSAGIGDLFVVRTAGNVVGSFELGSIEYAVQHLSAPLIVVMGHSHCGAVGAALDGGHTGGYIESVICEIRQGISCDATEPEAIHQNICHSKERVLQSEIVRCALHSGQIMMVTAEYNIETGNVHFFNG